MEQINTINGNIDIQIIRGQAFQLCLEFDGDVADTITKVVVSCRLLDFCKEMKRDTKNNLRWYCNFTSEETQQFISTATAYTLVVFNEIQAVSPLKKIGNIIKVYNDENEVCKWRY